MSRQHAVQLELPATLDQAAAMAQELALVRGYLEAAYEERAALQAETAALQTQLTAMRDSRNYYENLSHLARLTAERWRARETPALPGWLDTALKALIREAHPDRWSQGQPAGELAHALTVDLNALRAKLGEVRS